MKTSPAARQVELPKINLPKFQGSYLEWRSFHNAYLSLIHENSSLDDIQKMHYLKSAVSGEAAKLIQHLSITSEDYSAAWNILNNRYNNTRVLLNNHISAIIGIPKMLAESAAELRRVLDTFTQIVGVLSNLERPVKHWDEWLVYLLTSKLDQVTRKDWETTLTSSTALPTFQSLTTFLEGRQHTLTSIKGISCLDRKPTSVHRTFKTISRSHHTSASKHCIDCQGKHMLLFCPQFRLKSEERKAVLNSNKLCHNCLRPNHTASTCPSHHRCRYCNQNHHSMIHKAITEKQDTSIIKPSASQTTSFDQASASTSTHFSNHYSAESTVLLATAIVLVKSSDGRTLQARALLDQGSESSFITASLANLLRLPKKRINISVSGVGTCAVGVVKACVVHDVLSIVDDQYKYRMKSLVLPTLTHLLPAKQVVKGNWQHIRGLPLADPEYDKPARIDLILGADIYASILQGEVRRGCAGSPVAQLTSFGWVLSGSVPSSTPRKTPLSSFHSNVSDTDALLRRFWEIEEPPKVSSLTMEEIDCEQFFMKSHYRNNQGRYVVRLPLKFPANSLEQSRPAALSALFRKEEQFS